VTGLVPRRAEIRVSLSGAFGLSTDGESIDLAVPAQRVLALLALQDHAIDRSHVAAVLWRGSSPERAAGSLRSALWRIRQSGESIVEITNRGLRLSTTVCVDVRQTISWARRVGDATHSIGDDDVREAFDGGELLSDWDDDWVVVERERLRQLRLHSLEVLSQRLASVGRYGDAIEVALAALRNEPLRESAHRAVVSVHLAEGNPSEALRQYRRYRELLRAELGLEPSPLIKELVGVLEHRARRHLSEVPELGVGHA
jgi:DNA-binding SARP family transcriptional activator